MNTTPNPRATKNSRGELGPEPLSFPPWSELVGFGDEVVDVGDAILSSSEVTDGFDRKTEVEIVGHYRTERQPGASR